MLSDSVAIPLNPSVLLMLLLYSGCVLRCLYKRVYSTRSFSTHLSCITVRGGGFFIHYISLSSRSRM